MKKSNEIALCIIIFILLGISVFLGIEVKQLKNNQNRLFDITALISNRIDELNTDTKITKATIKSIIKRLDVRDTSHVTLTAYTSSEDECDGDPFITAFMTKVRPGTVAVSPYLLERGWGPGKKVYIQNFGIFIINDRMSSKYSDVARLDIWVETKEQAYKIGSRKVLALLIDNSA